MLAPCIIRIVAINVFAYFWGRDLINQDGMPSLEKIKKTKTNARTFALRVGWERQRASRVYESCMSKKKQMALFAWGPTPSLIRAAAGLQVCRSAPHTAPHTAPHSTATGGVCAECFGCLMRPLTVLATATPGRVRAHGLSSVTVLTCCVWKSFKTTHPSLPCDSTPTF